MHFVVEHQSVPGVDLGVHWYQNVGVESLDEVHFTKEEDI